MLKNVCFAPMMNDELRTSGEGRVGLPSMRARTAAITPGPYGNGRLPDITNRTPADDQRIALHESCHAITGRVLGQPLGGVSCDPGRDGSSGRCWGPSFEARFAKEEFASIVEEISTLMPGDGESRLADDVPTIFAHVHIRVVELTAGSTGEMLFLGDAWLAADDRAQERRLARLIASSDESAEKFIEFCAAEAATILRAHEHIVRALTKELLIRRTISGGEVDAIIAAAVAREALAAERKRRADWNRLVTSAAHFRGQMG
jgi:hypothetical protein